LGTKKRSKNTMAEITRFLFVRHLRAAPTSHVTFYKGERRKKSGRGLAFWFSPLGASIVEVPLDDREQPFMFHHRSQDFQQITVQGVVVYRVAHPEMVASRVDFSIDATKGEHAKQPLDKIAVIVTELALNFATGYLGKSKLRDVLTAGLDELQAQIFRGLSAEAILAEMGIEIVSVRVTSVKPTADMERALRTPTLESILEEADKATFQRRAIAVENERAIQENELQSQIELAKREEELVVQRGQNERVRAKEQAEKQRIEVEARIETKQKDSEADAASIRVVEAARVNAERERMDIYRDLPPAALVGLAAREIAGKLSKIENINVSPDLLGPLLGRLVDANGLAKR
jgi:regulator of protease activity HflC (stomatin/prohibitin superfamily)